MNREFTCITCPMGCRLKVEKEGNDIKVSGNSCKRGEIYAKQEIEAPKRMITSCVKINGADLNVIPVKTDKALPKELLFEAMKIINQAEVNAPVKIGDIVIENILDTGVNIIVTKNADLND